MKRISYFHYSFTNITNNKPYSISALRSISFVAILCMALVACKKNTDAVVCPDTSGVVYSSGEYTTGKTGDHVGRCGSEFYIADQDTNSVQLVDFSTGTVLKSYQLTAKPTDLELDRKTGRLYAALSSATSYAAIDTLSDAIKYIATTESVYSISAGKNGDVYFSTGSNYWKNVYRDSLNGNRSGPWPIDGGPIKYNSASNELLSATFGLSPANLLRYGFDESGNLVKLQDLRTGGSNGNALDISNDGRSVILAAGGGNGSGYSIYDFSASDLNVVFGEFVTGAYPSGAAFSPDDTLFAASNYAHLLVFDRKNHSEIMRKQIADCNYGDITSVSFSHDGGMVVAKQTCGSNYDEVKFHFFASPEKEVVTPPTSAFVSCPSYEGMPAANGTNVLNTKVGSIIGLCNGYILYSDEIKNQIHLRSTFDGKTLQSYQLTAKPYEMVLDKQNGYMFVSHGPASLFSRVNLNSGNVKTMPVSSGVQSIAINNDSTVFVKSNNGARVDIYNGISLNLLSSAVNFLGDYIAYNDATERLITSTYNYFYSKADHGFTLQGPSSGGGSGGGCDRVHVSPDGVHAAKPCGGGNGSGYSVLDFSSMDPSIVFGEWETGAYPSGAAFAPSNLYILLSDGKKGMLFDVDSHAVAYSFPTGNCSYSDSQGLAVAADGHSLYALTNCGADSDSAIVTWALYDTTR